MRKTADADAEATVLTTETGRALLAEVAEVREPRPSDLERWRKRASAEVVAAALRLVHCRRKARKKFTRAESLWLEPTALEQATAEPVARYKAKRFQDLPEGVVVDLCCGIGGDTLALAQYTQVLAVDREAGMLRRVRWNAKVYEVADRVLAVRARAEQITIPEEARIHIDPDRRAGKDRRARVIRDYAPDLRFLYGLTKQGRGGAIKLSPSSDFEAHFGGSEFEIEVISRGGECKEATVWFGDRITCQRRATCLPSGASWTDQDGPEESAEVASPADWIYEPDPALVRSGLLDRFAVAHGLARLGTGLDLLTGRDRLESPFLSTFAFVDSFPMDLKRLRRLVSLQKLGPLEIKTRRLDRSPELIRVALRPKGPNPATLILIGAQDREPSRAILAKRP